MQLGLQFYVTWPSILQMSYVKGSLVFESVGKLLSEVVPDELADVDEPPLGVLPGAQFNCLDENSFGFFA